MFPGRKKQIRISGGFWLLTAWFGLVNGWRLLGIVLGASAVHELGHCLALRCMGTGWSGLRLGVFGAVLEMDGRRLSYGGEIICVLMGPAANLLCALLLIRMGGKAWDVMAGANLVLCAFNLLPLRPLDGGRALYLAVSWLADPGVGEAAARWTGGLTGALLGTAVIWLMGRTGGSLWLLPAAVGAFFLAGNELLGNREFSQKKCLQSR